MCGEKQSLQRIFARSHSAKDCRQVSMFGPRCLLLACDCGKVCLRGTAPGLLP